MRGIAWASTGWLGLWLIATVALDEFGVGAFARTEHYTAMDWVGLLVANSLHAGDVVDLLEGYGLPLTRIRPAGLDARLMLVLLRVFVDGVLLAELLALLSRRRNSWSWVEWNGSEALLAVGWSVTIAALGWAAVAYMSDASASAIAVPLWTAVLTATINRLVGLRLMGRDELPPRLVGGAVIALAAAGLIDAWDASGPPFLSRNPDGALAVGALCVEQLLRVLDFGDVFSVFHLELQGAQPATVLGATTLVGYRILLTVLVGDLVVVAASPLLARGRPLSGLLVDLGSEDTPVAESATRELGRRREVRATLDHLVATGISWRGGGNALQLARNCGDRSVAPIVLQIALQHDAPPAADAASLLGEWRHGDALDPLSNKLRQLCEQTHVGESNTCAIWVDRVLQVVQQLDGPDAAVRLAKHALQGHEDCRWGAAQFLEGSDNSVAKDVLRTLIRDPQSLVRLVAIEGMLRVGDPILGVELERFLSSPDAFDGVPADHLLRYAADTGRTDLIPEIEGLARWAVSKDYLLISIFETLWMLGAAPSRLLDSVLVSDAASSVQKAHLIALAREHRVWSAEAAVEMLLAKSSHDDHLHREAERYLREAH